MGKFLKKAGKAAEFLTNRDYRLMVLGEYHVFGKAWLPDDEFLKVKFQRIMGYPLDLEHPRTFNEKLQWLKLYDRRPEYTIMVDKYAAKQYVADRIGSEYVIPTFGVWDRFDDIDFDALPNQFVLKCTDYLPRQGETGPGSGPPETHQMPAAQLLLERQRVAL